MIEFDFFIIILIIFASFSGAGVIYISILYALRFSQIATTRRLLLVDKSVDILDDQNIQKDKETIWDKLKIPQKLAWAGIALTPSAGLIIIASNGLFVGFLLYLFTQHFLGFILGFLASIYLLKILVEMKVHKRAGQFDAALAKAMSILVRMMRQGIGFEQAMQKAIDVSGSELFQNLMIQYLLEKDNVGEYDAFANLNRKISSDQLKVFSISIAIGRESGGSFAATLEKLEKTIVDKQKLQEKIDVATKESTMGTYIIIMLVALLYYIFNQVNHNEMNDFYFSSPTGKLYFIAICGLIVVGLIVNKKLTKVKT
jgi:tight adherence protein B